MRIYLHRFRETLGEARRHWVRCLIQSALWWLAFSTFSSALWIRQKFGVPSFDQFLFHIQLGVQGLLTSEYYVIKSFIVTCVILPGAAALAVSTGVPAAGMKDLLDMNRRWLKKLSFIAPVAGVLLASAFLLDQVSFFTYAAGHAGRDYFSAHYRDPRQVALAGNDPRNLVLIYVESLDASYGDARLFGKDLLQRLDAPAHDKFSFARYSQVPGTGWTMAALAATQCGVPLEAVTLYDGNTQEEKLKHFLPGAACLGDILDGFGYRNVFMGGASLAFAGKGKFFKDHHYAERYGKEEWIAQGDSAQNMSGWGLHDDDLFRHAEAKLDALETSGGRFNLTLLTLDTHYPESGSLSKSCLDRGARTFEDTVECTADQVAAFVAYIRDKGYLKNLNVVVLGDHLAMKNPAAGKLAQVRERGIFNLFIAENAPPKNHDEIVHFDLYPTLLDFIGIHVPQGRLALGYSGFSSLSPTLEAERLADMRSNLLHPSPLYLSLWKKQANAARHS